MNVLIRSVLRCRLNRPTILTAVVLAMVVAHPGVVSAVPIISLSPTPASAAVGDLISLDLEIADATDLFAYQFDITFDPAILQAVVVSDGGFLTSGGGISLFGGVFTLSLDNTSGVITILDSLLGPAPPATGISGAGILATLVFTGLMPGTSDILFSTTILEDSSGAAADAVISGGQVTITGDDVSSVPEPGTASLVLLGLMGAAASRRRRQISLKVARH